jgi:hypothetical protein
MGATGRGRIWLKAALGVCALTLAVIVLGCGDSTPADTATAETSPVDRSGPTEAVLNSLNDSGVTGTVVYVKQSSGLPVMKIRLSGLESAGGEKQYFMWQMGSRHNMVSFASYHVPKSGKLSVDLEPNPESLSFLEDGSTTEFLVTKVLNDDRFFAAQERAPSASEPAVIGEPVARGPFTGPLVGSPPAATTVRPKSDPVRPKSDPVKATTRPRNNPPPTARERAEARGKVVLQPVAAGTGSGFALFGPGAHRDTRTVLVRANGPNAPHQLAGSLWFVGVPGKMVLLGSFEVNRDGRMNSKLEVDAETLRPLEDGTFDEVLVTYTNWTRVDPPSYTGIRLMRGPITGPIAK